MKNIEFTMPDYDYESDSIIINLMISVAFAPMIYGAFIGYFYGAMKIIWFFCSIILSVLIQTVSRKIQTLGAKLQKFKKLDFDPDKSIRNYIKVRKSLLSILYALIICGIFFFAAYLIRQNYINTVKHDTVERAKGYVYEVVASGIGFLTAYVPALIWFVPDDILYYPETPTIHYVIPVAMLILPPIIMAVPIYFAIIYIAAYLILLLIRILKIRRFYKNIEKLKQEARIKNHRSRFD